MQQSTGLNLVSLSRKPVLSRLEVIKVIRLGGAPPVSSPLTTLPNPCTEGSAPSRPWIQSWSWTEKRRTTECAQVLRHMRRELPLFGCWAPSSWGLSPNLCRLVPAARLPAADHLPLGSATCRPAHPARTDAL